MPLSAPSLSSDLYAAMESAFGDPGGSAQTWQDVCDAIASTVVAHIVENATITLTITTSDGALQTYGALIDTTPPAANRVLTCAIS